nr:MAG TPA: hypothetical protein [Caudoviricetes sp.]
MNRKNRNNHASVIFSPVAFKSYGRFFSTHF